MEGGEKMETELNDIRLELERMNIHLENISGGLAVIATALDRGVKEISSEISRHR